MNIDLTHEEARIIGCLMEKAVTTPDQYPLTLNALTNACNQKSSRDPVMNLHQGDVQRTARLLKEKFLVSIEEAPRSNTEKYSQRICNTLLSECQFDGAEYAVICLLLLRGAQTPGELRSRGSRLHNFDDNQQVVESLKALMDREGGPLVARLPRKAGRQDHEYASLFLGNIESVPEEAGVVQRVPSSDGNQRIDKLEARLEALENALIGLANQLGEEIRLVQSGAEKKDD